MQIDESQAANSLRRMASRVEIRDGCHIRVLMAFRLIGGRREVSFLFRIVGVLIDFARTLSVLHENGRVD